MLTLIIVVLVFAVAMVAIAQRFDRTEQRAKTEYAHQPNPEYRFCPLCSAPLRRSEVAGRSRLNCTDCGFVHWDNPKPVTITLVPKDDGLVLVKRKLNPGAGKWALPGGFIEGFEGPADGARREVWEETGLLVEIDRVVGSFGARPGVNQVILVFITKPASGKIVAGDDAEDARVFKRDEVPADIAFPLHKWAIEKYFDRKL
jgi:ADP-ribose pyrophosphatase YjhB (NUDIX family)